VDKGKSVESTEGGREVKNTVITMKDGEVRVVLCGKKTSIRSIIVAPVRNWEGQSSDWNKGLCFKGTALFDNGPSKHPSPSSFSIQCPYGQPGDRLVVKEAWRVGAWDENCGKISVDYRADMFARKDWIDIPSERLFEKLWIESTEDAEKAGFKTDGDGQYKWEDGRGPCRWRGASTMPKEATRIVLEIKNITTERLQNISDLEARQEGFIPDIRGGVAGCKRQFVGNWDRRYRGTSYSWEENPWVWVVEFRKGLWVEQSY